MENGENSRQKEADVTTPLIRPHSTSATEHHSETNSGGGSKNRNPEDKIWMVYLSTLVALCGSLQFGICSGYSSPTQSTITEELGLSTAQFSVFGSILTCGAITSGSMADLIGRKGVDLWLNKLSHSRVLFQEACTSSSTLTRDITTVGGSDMEKGENSRQEEADVTTPLIHRNSTSAAEDRSETNSGGGIKNRNPEDRIWMVYLSTLVALCGSLQFGICSGYSSPTQSAITEELGLSTAQFSVFGSILTCGAMVGAITSGSMADLIGRKGTMAVSSCMCVAGWISIYFAEGVISLDIGRLATGYGMGVFSYVVPVFIAEITPKDVRGALTTLNMVVLGCGLTSVYALGAVLAWRNLALIGLVPCGVQLLGIFLIPESPRWLAKIGQHHEFEAALQQLRGKGADISEEASEIQDYVQTSQILTKSKMTDLFQRKYRRSLMVGVGMMAFQQLGGVNGVCYYMSSIFESIGFSSTIGSVTYSSFQVAVCLLTATRMDNTGRKPFLLVSVSGMLLGCILVGTSFFLKAHNASSSSSDALAVIGLLVYGGSYAAGMGAIPWMLISEMFPVNIKGVAGSLAALVNWIAAWTVSYTFNYLILWSSYGTFLLYAAVNALAILFIVTAVPETSGKSLEAIQAALNV